MLVNLNPSPHGSPQVGPVLLESSGYLNTHVVIENNILLFEFESKSGPFEVEVFLNDNKVGSQFAGVVVRSEESDVKKYVEFSDFPWNWDGSQMESCSCQVNLRGESEVWMTIYRG